MAVSQRCSRVSAGGSIRTVAETWRPPPVTSASATLAVAPEGAEVLRPKASRPTTTAAAAGSAIRLARGSAVGVVRSATPIRAPTTPPATPAASVTISTSGSSDPGHGSVLQTCDQPHSAARPSVPTSAPATLGGGRFEVPSPTLMRASEELAGLGVPLAKQLDVLESLVRHADSVAGTCVRLFLDRVWKPFDRAGQPEEQWPQVHEALERLRPLATDTLVATFQLRMTHAVEKAFGRELDRRRSKG